MFEYELLEQEFAQYIDVKDVVSVNTGTASLHLAFEGKHYPKGSEVIIPEFTMVATAWGPQYAGLTVVPVDCREDMNIDASLIEDRITDKTVAILITHIYGRICDMQPILDLCEKYDLDLFEDCAEVHGAVYHDGPRKGHKVGSLGIGCFSFYRNKIVSGEEGGCVTIPDDTEYANHLRYLKNMSFGPEHDYIHRHQGFNYRMSDAQARMIRQSLRAVDDNNRYRKDVESWYDKYLDKKYKRPTRDVVWIYDINHDSAHDLVKHLSDKGIAARRCFYPMSLQPSVNCKESFDLLSLDLYNRTCYLPVTDSITHDQVKEICDIVNNYG